MKKEKRVIIKGAVEEKKNFDYPYNEIELIFYRGGALGIRPIGIASESFVYFYPNQLKQLKKELRK